MRRNHDAVLALGLIVLAACSGSSTRIPLSYDEALAEAEFPNPAAHLTINGRSAWFLFDTGAGVHVLATWFVESAGLELAEDLADEVSGTDSTGQDVEFHGVRNLEARLENGTILSLAFAAVADFPEEFEQSHVGGILSPQLLAGPGQAAALDLRVPELRLEPFGKAMRSLGAHALPSHEVQFCGSLDDPIPNLVFGVPVTTATGRGVLELDSGAKTSTVAADSPLVRGVQLGAGGEEMGLSGERRPYLLASGLRIGFAGYSFSIDSRVVDTAGGACDTDGLLGLDVLGHCALVLGAGELAMVCDP